jgi:hypothetical protein
MQFRPLPFYDKSCFLIEPAALKSRGIVGKPNEAEITFQLTIDQADYVAMDRDKVNIILRFCHIESDTEQDDNFPPEITIIVNGNQVGLAPAISNPNRPNVPPKRPGQHVDITKFCKLCPFVTNKVMVRWFIDPTDKNRAYATSIIIGEKVSSEELLNRIKERGYSDPEATKRLISDSDSEVATTNLQYSLMCPLGKMKMANPCKSTKCNHILCFDAFIYLQMNEKKATWICPICYKPAYYPDLIIDGFFMDIIEKTDANVTEVTLNLDGTWSPVLKMEQKSTTKNPPPEVITISSDEDE